MRIEINKRPYRYVSKLTDGGIELFVFKTFSTRKQRWIYSVFEDYVLADIYNLDLTKLK